jgi:signal transduction histidine kinase
MTDRFYRLLPWLVLAFSLLLTVWSWREASDENERIRRLHFDRLFHQFTSAISDRVDSYSDSHSAAAALFRHSVVVTSREWRQFVDSLDIDRRHPGLSGAGYIEVVESADLPVFESRTRFDGHPDYRVHGTPDRARYYPVKFIEPIERNLAVLGLDMQNEASSFEAMERARDAGRTRMSQHVTLMQDERHPVGFLLYLPLYGSEMPPRTIEERRRMLTGWIYASFVSQEFIDGLLGELLPEAREQLSLAIYSGAEISESTRLYRDPFEVADPPDSDAALIRTAVFDMLGQPWTFMAKPGAAFADFVPPYDAPRVRSSGLMISAAVFGLFLSMTRTRSRALALAQDMTRDLAARTEALECSNRELEAAVRTAEQAADALLEQHATLARTDRMAAVGEMAGGLAHEIRNPLAGIRMSLQNLHTETRDEVVRERIEAPIAELDRLARLLNRYLSPLRHEPEPLSAVALRELVDELCGLLRYRLPETIRLDANVSEDIEWMLPKDRIRQSLLNLVLNAIQAIGEASGTIWITAVRHGDRLDLCVEDDGPGFPETVLEGPVQRFQSHTEEGTGLGLAMVRRVAEDLGGRLLLERRAPRGACVRIELPAQPAPTSPGVVG